MSDRVILGFTVLFEILSYFLSYKTMFHTRFSRGILRYFIYIFVIIAISFLYHTLIIADPVPFFLITGLILPLLFAEQNKFRWFSLFLVILFFCSVLDTVILNGLSIITPFFNTENRTGSVQVMITKLIACILLFLFIVIQRILTIPDDELHPTAPQFAIYYIITASSFVIVSINDELVSTMSNKDTTTYKLYFFASMVAYLALAALCMYQGFIISRTRSQQERIKAYEEFSKMQKAHIENLIYQDQEMRKFRHDMNLHLATIQTLCQNGETEKLDEYCGRYTGQGALLSMDKYCCDSGIDAILSNFKRSADIKGIKTNYDIVYENSGRIDSYDLCIILMNTLQNAIEANEGYSGEKYIYLTLHDIANTITITVENPFDTASYPVTGKTSKKNSKNHGFGLQNVKDSVNRYDGTLSFETNGKTFRVIISIIKVQ